MSARARRRREQADAARRALLGTRDNVIAAVTRRMPRAGSVAIEEAVDAALEQLLEEGAERCELGYARNWWISWARRRLVDNHRTAAYKDRDPVPVDEHPRVLARHAAEDPLDRLDGDELVAPRLAELIASLAGPQREWADALFAEMRRAVAAEESGEDHVGRELHDVLGWSAAKEKKTAHRARKTMTAFVADRATGKICSRRQAVLDAYITAADGHDATRRADGDRREFQAVALHLAGCPECQIAWAQRRTSLGRFGAFVIGPLEGLTAGAHALAGKLADACSGAQQAVLWLLQRIGLVSGAGAAAGGSAITLTAKTAAVCAGLVCAVTAGGELTGVLPPILAKAPDRELVDAARKAPKAPAAVTRTRSSSTPARAAVPPPPPPTGAAATSLAKSSTARVTATRTRSTPPPPPPASSQRVTPGDLPLASSTRTPTLTRPPSSSGSTAPSTSTPTCTPGDLGC